MIYDYIIIGAGPSGLALSYIISHMGHTCLVIDREPSPGGCHRVIRTKNGLFTEHGPRIYGDNYKTFYHLLDHAGLDPSSYFTEYKFSITPWNNKSGDDSIMTTAMKIFTFKEALTFVEHYTFCALDPKPYKEVSIHTITQDFSKASSNYIDKMCRLSEGAGKERYTAYEFFQLLNQGIFYKIRQPNIANDKGWVTDLVKVIKKNGTRFLFNREVSGILRNTASSLPEYEVNHIGTGSDISDSNINYARNVIFATPVQTLEKFFDNFSGVNLKIYKSLSTYDVYIPITLHWSKKITLTDLWGQGIGKWNIAWIVLSDYMRNESETLITCCITKINVPGEGTHKSANHCNREELIDEVKLQLKPLIGSNIPDKMLIYSTVYKDRGGNRWNSRDTAHMATPYVGNFHFPYKLDGENIYSVGSHNANSTYAFTSAESAVQNSYNWAHRYLPGSRKEFKVQYIVTLNIVISMIMIIIMIPLFMYFLVPMSYAHDILTLIGLKS